MSFNSNQQHIKILENFLDAKQDGPKQKLSRSEKKEKKLAEKAKARAAKSPATATDSTQHSEASASTPTSALTPSAESSHTPTQSTQAQPHQQNQGNKPKQQRSTGLEKQNQFFLHLPQYVEVDQKPVIAVNNEGSHPAIVRLGQQYLHGVIVGSNARCIALLNALKEMILDYSVPADKRMSADLDARLKPIINYIKTCRPISVSMGNAIKYLKVHIHHLSPHTPENEAKSFLIEKIDMFITERIIFADKSIATSGASRINNGDVIMTYARSSVVEAVLRQAKADGKNFSVIIVDSRPRYEGRELLSSLSELGIPCTYALLNAVSYLMKGVSKVMVGAHTLLTNGTVVSRAGTASVAMMARSYNVPFLVCCETYKFSEKVQLDSITNNELGNPDEIAHINRVDVPEKLSDWRTTKNLNLLNLVYDSTPTHFVDMVITEVGMIPPTSVPVIIREYRKEVSV